MTFDVMHLFLCLFSICISSLVSCLLIFIYLFKIYFFLYLAASVAARGIFVAAWGIFCCGVQVLHCGTLASLQLWHTGSRACRLSSCGMQHSLVVACGLQSAQAQLPCGMWDLSSPTRDQTRVPCIGRQILNYWTTREVPRLFIFKIRLFIFLLLSFKSSLYILDNSPLSDMSFCLVFSFS